MLLTVRVVVEEKKDDDDDDSGKGDHFSKSHSVHIHLMHGHQAACKDTTNYIG